MRFKKKKKKSLLHEKLSSHKIFYQNKRNASVWNGCCCLVGHLKELQFLGPTYFQQLSKFHPQQASKWSPPNQSCKFVREKEKGGKTHEHVILLDSIK